MSHSIIGFHYSTGGTKDGIGGWIDNATSKGIPVGLKGVSDYGLIFEAIQKGNPGWLVYRLSKAAGSVSRETPNYTVDPVIDAEALAAETVSKLPPEFDKSKVWIELINEPRGKWTDEPVWGGLHPVDYLGEWCYAAAGYLNAQGYKFCGPSFNSGEPGDDGKPLSDVTAQYLQPGMRAYLKYCADNPDMAALAVHEYVWSLPAPQYPQLWGRFEAAIAAADLAGIPRTFHIFVTEWGYSPNNAPSFPAVTPDLDRYNQIAARFPQVKFAAAWTLQSGYDPVDDQIITWTNYPIEKQFDAGQQPAVTHAAFGGTLPDDTEEPTMDTRDFEGPGQTWTNMPAPYRVQIPNGFTAAVIDVGQPLWYPGGDTGGKATGTVEALHKGCDFSPPTLPPHQCADGSDPLVLSGQRCYKIQAVDMASGTSLKTTFQGTGRKRITVPIQVHWQVDQPNEVDDVYVGVIMNGQTVKLLQHPELKDRTWHYVVGEFDAPITVETRFQTSYRNRRDFFTDYWICEDLEDEPMTWEQQLAATAESKKVLAFKKGASLQMRITADGFQARTNEFDSTLPDGTTPIVCRGAIHPATAEIRVYYAQKSNYGDVRYIVVSGGTPTPTPFKFSAYPVQGRPYTITSPFNAPRSYGLHEGIDLSAPMGWTIVSVADGVVDYIRTSDISGYGLYVRVKHNERFSTWYAHLQSVGVTVGQPVTAGQILGLADSTGNSTGSHLHLTLQDMEQGLDGYVVAKVVNPKPFLDAIGTPPPPAGIDLRRFMIADPTAWRVVKGPGGQEDVQDLQLSNGLFVRRKNQLAEWWRVDGTYFYLVHDTSPDKGGEGVERLYTLYKGSVPGAPKNPITMAVGQSWTETGTHHVQFRAKSDCRLLSENSGFAQNTAVLVDHKTNVVFNAYGQNLRVDEVVWIKTGVETQVYGRHNGKAIGWIGWAAPWGNSEIVELYFDRPPMTQEPNRYCGW